jgi:outer membrane immunogenic protein
MAVDGFLGINRATSGASMSRVLRSHRVAFLTGCAMRTLVFGSIALTSLVAAGPAMAADIRIKAPAYKAPPVFSSWTGFYVGANAGYGWQNDRQVNFVANDPYSTLFLSGGLAFGGTPVVPPRYNLKGGSGGLQAGFNWQVNPSWLVGFETDLSGSSINGTGTTTSVVSAPGVVSTVVATQRIRWFGTVRARLGWLPAENWLLYATGGFAYGQIDEAINVGFAGGGGAVVRVDAGGFGAACVFSPNCFIGASQPTATGWTAGAGSEYFVTRNLTLKAEYLYMNLGSGGSFNVVAQSVFAGSAPSTFRAVWGTVDFHTVRVGFNYKLDLWD